VGQYSKTRLRLGADPGGPRPHGKPGHRGLPPVDREADREAERLLIGEGASVSEPGGRDPTDRERSAAGDGPSGRPRSG
jgi:hypothetical protein